MPSTPPVAFMAVATVWPRNCQKNETTTTTSMTEKLYRHELYFCKKKLQCKTTNGIRTQVDLENKRTSRSCQQLPDAIWSVHLFLSFLPFVPPLFCLATHESAILAIFDSTDDELHHEGLGDQLEDDDDGCWRSEFCGSAMFSAQ